MIIAIDPGHGMSNRVHGRYDTGAVCTTSSCTFAEADFTLKFGLTMSFLATEAGHQTFMTRWSSADDAPVGRRAKRAQHAGSDVFISFHLNSNEGTPGQGMEVLYRDASKDKPLAVQLQNSLVNATGLANHGGVKQRLDLAVLKFISGPAVLIELGFINNDHDRAYLAERDHRIVICQTILDILTR